ncbi:hypothetical protein SAMN00790413_05085 [Deinococcus hopiensis KR-140]|uniref:Uncharacterized protein n=1 Tax=Deinococcus hopiensis KR-140 TaxID=695939 RepID=A0A1W1UTG2_9DEIO|nr:hypothetical protein SAMN00790413_05085 [Deinococcus hopiensis KR-140]
MDHCSSVSRTFLACHTALSQNSDLFPDDLYADLLHFAALDAQSNLPLGRRELNKHAPFCSLQEVVGLLDFCRV